MDSIVISIKNLDETPLCLSNVEMALLEWFDEHMPELQIKLLTNEMDRSTERWITRMLRRMR